METFDIWRAADVMMKLYHDDAMAKALMRADAQLEQGDMGGFFVWKQIAQAIDSLRCQTRPPGVALN